MKEVRTVIYYAELQKRKNAALSQPVVKPPKDPTHLCDFSETDPYRFTVREKGKTIAEGSLIKIKMVLDESYLKKKIKAVRRNKENMTAVLEY